MKSLLIAVLFTINLAAQSAGGLCNTWNPGSASAESKTKPRTAEVNGLRVMCAKVSLDLLSRTVGAPVAPGFPDQVQVWIWSDDPSVTAFSVDVRYEVIQNDGSTKEITKEATVRRLKWPEGQAAGMTALAQVFLELPADRIKVVSVSVEPLVRRSEPLVLSASM